MNEPRIGLSSGDLQGIEVKALEESMPYQTLIASVLHKYVSGRLSERDTEASLNLPLPKAGRRTG